MRMRGFATYGVIAAVLLLGVAVVVVAQAPAPRGGGDRAAQMAQMMEQMRQRMIAAGATEADLQALQAYRQKQDTIMEPLRQAVEALGQAAGETGTADQAKTAITQWEAAKTKALADLAKAESDLKTQLNLAAKPKLHAMLLSMGTLDNGTRGGGRFGGGGFGGRGGGGGGGGAPGGRGA